jgi:hypothetical protein
MEGLNTTSNENIDSVDDVDGVCIKGLEEQRRLLEDRLAKEEAEVALLARLVELAERDRALAERESALERMEQELEEELASSDLEEGIDEIKRNLLERFDILERRGRRLDLIEAQLKGLEDFIENQETRLKNIRGRRKRRRTPKRKSE